MTETLADIEVLVLRCRSENSRDYIAEAVKCYRSAAYRSTIVNVWIAVVFDLIDKVRELDRANEPSAKILNAQYETYIGQINSGNDQGVKLALEFERDILTTCRDKLQFFDHQQFRDLMRLREDRHQCAHPSFQRPGEPYRPSAEQARLHLRNAVVHVLSQPPVQGRTAIAELISIVSSTYFPLETDRAVATLRNSPLVGGTDALIRGFIDTLVFGYFEPAGPVQGKAQVGSAINATLELNRTVTESRLAQQLNKVVRDLPDADFPQVATLLALVPGSLFLIDAPARIRIGEFVRTGPERELVKSIVGLASHPEIGPIASAKILTFDIEPLAEGIAVYGFGCLAKERSLNLLSTVGSWTRANDVLARCVLPLFQFLTAADIERVIRMPTETGADLPGAGGYATFLNLVRRSQLIPDVQLNTLLTENKAGYLIE
jgi:hypothetical protein